MTFRCCSVLIAAAALASGVGCAPSVGAIVRVNSNHASVRVELDTAANGTYDLVSPKLGVIASTEATGAELVFRLPADVTQEAEERAHRALYVVHRPSNQRIAPALPKPWTLADWLRSAERVVPAHPASVCTRGVEMRDAARQPPGPSYGNTSTAAAPSPNARQRAKALEQDERDPAALGNVIWSLCNDSAPGIRKKAWRILRGRWGSSADADDIFDRAARWVVENAKEMDWVLEAVKAVEEHSTRLDITLSLLEDSYAQVRAAGAKAAFRVGQRTGHVKEALTALRSHQTSESNEEVRKIVQELINQVDMVKLSRGEGSSPDPRALARLDSVRRNDALWKRASMLASTDHEIRRYAVGFLADMIQSGEEQEGAQRLLGWWYSVESDPRVAVRIEEVLSLPAATSGRSRMERWAFHASGWHAFLSCRGSVRRYRQKSEVDRAKEVTKLCEAYKSMSSVTTAAKGYVSAVDDRSVAEKEQQEAQAKLSKDKSDYESTRQVRTNSLTALNRAQDEGAYSPTKVTCLLPAQKPIPVIPVNACPPSTSSEFAGILCNSVWETKDKCVRVTSLITKIAKTIDAETGDGPPPTAKESGCLILANGVAGRLRRDQLPSVAVETGLVALGTEFDEVAEKLKREKEWWAPFASFALKAMAKSVAEDAQNRCRSKTERWCGQNYTTWHQNREVIRAAPQKALDTCNRALTDLGLADSRLADLDKAIKAGQLRWNKASDAVTKTKDHEVATLRLLEERTKKLPSPNTAEAPLLPLSMMDVGPGSPDWEQLEFEE